MVIYDYHNLCLTDSPFVLVENYKILHNKNKAEYSTQKLSAAAATKTQIQCDLISKSDASAEKKASFCSRTKLCTNNLKHTNNATAVTYENLDQDSRKNVETALSKMLRLERRMDQSKSTDAELWKTDDESNSCSDSMLTGSSCCSSPTPKSSPKRSPLLVKRVIGFLMIYSRAYENCKYLFL